MPAPAPNPHYPSQIKKMRFSFVAALTALASTAFAAHEICVLVEPKGKFSRFTVVLHAKNDNYLMHQTGEHKTAKAYTFRNDRGWVDIKKDLKSFTAAFDGGAWGTSFFQQEKWLKKNQKLVKWGCYAGQEAPEYCADTARKWAGCQKIYS
ncbi:hypothetical protein MVEG_08257 [Podila verticillata NRRL 6337]|nr:hypothetical protein MVEG_08257 [Podila verticillata NRRL 6337]